MTKILSIAVFLLISKSICAQYIKIDNGAVLSSFNNEKNLSLLKSDIFGYSFLVGTDYLENKWFYLSSEIGYNGIGGKDVDTFIQGKNINISERRDYIHFNTTFRAYIRRSGLTLFGGLGPYTNVLTSPKSFSSELYKPFYELKTFHLGSKGEIGITQQINKFKVGLVGAYLFSMTPLASSSYLSLKNNAYSLSISAGYRIR